LQEQNYSLEALAKRDAQADPFAPNTPAAPPQPSEPQQPDAQSADQTDNGAGDEEAATVPKSISLDRVNDLFARAA
jgi:hypothetical protein